MYKKVGFFILLIGAWINAAENPMGAGVEAVVPLHEAMNPGGAGVEVVVPLHGAIAPHAQAGYYTVTIHNRSPYRMHYDIVYYASEGLDPIVNDGWLDVGTGINYYMTAGEYSILYDFPDSPNPADRRQEFGGGSAENIDLLDENIEVNLNSIG